jgi:hypothetical protein
MSGEGKEEEKGNEHLGFLCLKTHKEHIFLVDSGLKQPQVFEQFSNVRTRRS